MIEEPSPEWLQYQRLKTYVIDGERFSNLEGFYDEIERILIPGKTWGRNLDAFNDILCGGFGTPEDGFVLRWRHSAKSRVNLGYAETARMREVMLGRCHPANRPFVSRKLRDARQRRGPTLFDDIVEILRDHGPEGVNSRSNVRLKLE